MDLRRNVSDSGWAWIILAASFFVQLITGLFIYSLGILNVGLLDTFQQSVFTTSWVGSLYAAVMLIAGPAAAYLVNVTNCRTSVILSGILTFVSCVSSTFVTDLKLLYLTFGIIGGLGMMLTFMSATVVLGYYFKEKLYLANGISVTGLGLAMVMSPVISKIILAKYCYQGFMLILGAIGLNLCVFGALLAPNSMERKAKPSTSKNVWKTLKNGSNLFRNLSYDLYCLSMLFFSVQYTFISQFLPLYSTQNGQTLFQASLVLSVSGVASTVSRSLTGVFTNDSSVDGLMVYFGTTGMLSLVTGLFPLYGEYYTGQLLYGIVFGAYTGSTATIRTPITGRLVGIPQLVAGYSYVMMFSGVGSLLGPPMGGFILEQSGSLEISFVAAGVTQLLASVTGILTAAFEKRHGITAAGADNTTETMTEIRPAEPTNDDMETSRFL